MSFMSIMAQLVSETLKEPVPTIEIESEVVALAIHIQEATKNRTVEDINTKLGMEGWLGQELFNGCLLQYKIPNVYANPIYEKAEVFRKISDKHFDFYIPTIGYISVKTTPSDSYKTRFMANVEKWKDEVHDIAVAIKIESLKERRARLYGWLYESDVERLPIDDFGQGPAYWTYLDRKKVESNRNKEEPKHASKKLIPLRNASDLLKELENAKRFMKMSHKTQQALQELSKSLK